MVYIDLIFNLSLMVAISLLSGWIETRWKRQTFKGMVSNGFLFGLAAILSMANPVVLGEGIIFDGRPVIVSVCGLIFGPWAGTVTSLMAAAMRIWIGGVGVAAGLLLILVSLLAGVTGHEILRRKQLLPSILWLFMFGVLVNLTLLFIMILLGASGSGILSRLWLPVVLIYPLATVISGKILALQAGVVHSLEAFQQTKQNFDVILNSIGDAVIATDLSGNITFMNPVAEKFTGWTQSESLGRRLSHIFRLVHEKTREHLNDPVKDVLARKEVLELNRHCLLLARDRTERPIADSAAPILSDKGAITGVVLVFRDQSEERRIRKLQEIRLTLVEYSAGHSLSDLLRKALDETGDMVDSPIGFYHFVEEDGVTLSLQQWSTRTLEEFCHTEAFGNHYPVDKAGVWVDCIHQQGPVVHNDYESLPHKKGLPEGHANVIRQLVVPIFRGGRVVGILGVGNKPEDYTDSDVATVSYLADVTWQIVDKKRMEEAREKSDLLFRSVFRNHSAVKLILDPDTGAIIDANRAAEEFYGWTRDQLIAMKVDDINTLSTQEIKDEMAKARSMRRVYFEFKHRMADGAIRDVAVFSSKIEVKGKDYLHSIVHDITDRKQAEKDLIESELKYRQLIELAPIGIFSTTSKGDVLSANTAMARILDMDTPEEAIRNFNNLQDTLYVNPEDREQVIRELTEDGLVENFEYLAKTARDRKIWLSMNARIAGKYDDDTYVIEGFTTDITAQKKMEEQFRQAQKMESVGRLAGGVAHDYNNMLSVILGYTELALTKIGEDNPLYKDLHAIHDAATRSTEVTRQLLAFARKQAITPKIIDVNETIEGALKMLRRLIGEDIELVWLPGVTHDRVNMDPSQIDQILANLCVNARDALPSNGKITIETGRVHFDSDYCEDHPGFLPGSFVMLAVSDNGEGMDKDIRENLFEPFFTTKEVGKGTGLGLATVYGIVKQNKGFINVYSEPGQGSTIRVYFPGHQLEPDSLPDLKGNPIVPGHGETVLLVEDEPAILNMGTLMLEKLGYRVLAANTASQAIRMAELHADDIQLLITDVIMPDMNGRMLSETLTGKIPGLKCLFMSGYTANVIAQHGVLEEDMHFIQKPFSMEAFARAVHTILNPDPRSA